MALLFEYGDWEGVKNIGALKPILQEIWKQRLFVDPDIELDDEMNDKRYQPFLKFDSNNVRANNFVGFIQNGDQLIEIYPKVFKNLSGASEKKEFMLRHIFYWFSYCRKWRFPFNKASLDTLSIDEFPELLINLIANQFLETVSKQPLSMYHHLEEALETPRGTINFNRYINNSLAHGKFQSIECDYEPFLFDNNVNRIIKYCARLLMNQTKFHENLRTLQEVIFVLDDVSDLPCSIHDIENVSLNSFFEDYLILIDNCKLILNQQLYSSNNYDLSQWCLLFPMEYIFEDFLAGFLEDKFSKQWKVEYQKSDQYLSNTPKVFNMQHDIFLTDKSSGRKIIVDTKYKVRDKGFKFDPKKGIAQNDLYQMVSYAFKRGCTDILLVYPNISGDINPLDHFDIISGFSGNEKINVTALEISFWTDLDIKTIDKKLFDWLELNLNQIKVGN